MPRRCFTIAALFLCGCYEFLPPPTRTEDLTGKRVQITLTDAGSLVLAPDIGPQNDAVAGTLLSHSSEAFVVSVASVRNRIGLETGWNGERVAIPRAVIARLEERRFSKRRTVLASAALIASLLMAQRAFGGAGGATTPGSGPSGPGTGR